MIVRWHNMSFNNIVGVVVVVVVVVVVIGIIVGSSWLLGIVLLLLLLSFVSIDCIWVVAIGIYVGQCAGHGICFIYHVNVVVVLPVVQWWSSMSVVILLLLWSLWFIIVVVIGMDSHDRWIRCCGFRCFGWCCNCSMAFFCSSSNVIVSGIECNTIVTVFVLSCLVVSLVDLFVFLVAYQESLLI